MRRRDGLLHGASCDEAPAMHFGLLLAPASTAADGLRFIGDGSLRGGSTHRVHEDDVACSSEVGTACSALQGQEQHAGASLPTLLLKSADDLPALVHVAGELEVRDAKLAQCRGDLPLKILPLAEDDRLLALAADLAQAQRDGRQFAAGPAGELRKLGVVQLGDSPTAATLRAPARRRRPGRGGSGAALPGAGGAVRGQELGDEGCDVPGEVQGLAALRAGAQRGDDVTDAGGVEYMGTGCDRKLLAGDVIVEAHAAVPMLLGALTTHGRKHFGEETLRPRGRSEGIHNLVELALNHCKGLRLNFIELPAWA
mmetsp:Transcript_87400/g.280321  ORF Transcript_87400/g.280321 Transcript_87400/m.280321 type:complete len:312 (+) Transcript_87400:1245-2180(+)